LRLVIVHLFCRLALGRFCDEEWKGGDNRNMEGIQIPNEVSHYGQITSS